MLTCLVRATAFPLLRAQGSRYRPKALTLMHQVSYPRRLLCLWNPKGNTVPRISLPKSCECILETSAMPRPSMLHRLLNLVHSMEGLFSHPTPSPLCHGVPVPLLSPSLSHFQNIPVWVEIFIWVTEGVFRVR